MADKKKESWEVTLAGYESFDDDGAKAAFERQLVLDAGLFVEQVKKLSNVVITKGGVSTDSQIDIDFAPPEETPKEREAREEADKAPDTSVVVEVEDPGSKDG